MSEFSLTIKEWLGTGTPDLKLTWNALISGERFNGSRWVTRLLLTRKRDHHSSRFAMMAQLNKGSKSLSWGFLEGVIVSEVTTGAPHVFTRTTTFIYEVGVADVRVDGDEETITFYANKKSADFAMPVYVP